MSVVQYLRGIDLSGINLQTKSDKSNLCLNPSTQVLSQMCRLQWLRLRNVGLNDQTALPVELEQLNQLEHLSLARNSLESLNSLKSWPSVLPNLRMITCRKNKLTGSDFIQPSLFDCPNLQVYLINI